MGWFRFFKSLYYYMLISIIDEAPMTGDNTIRGFLLMMLISGVVLLPTLAQDDQPRAETRREQWEREYSELKKKAFVARREYDIQAARATIKKAEYEKAKAELAL